MTKFKNNSGARATLRATVRILLIAMMAPAALAQTPSIAGDYTGTQGGVRVVLHLAVDANGTLTASTDTPEQGVFGLPCADVVLKGQQFSFSVPQVHGTWTGFVTDNGSTLAGMWNQATPSPMNFTRQPSAAVVQQAPPSEVHWDDYTFKFIQGGTMVQALQNGKLVGTIVTRKGEERVIPVPGSDAQALQKSYDDYRVFAARSHSPQAPGMTDDRASNVPKAMDIRFDDIAKSITVPRPDGTFVTFIGNDIRISGKIRGTGYLLRPQSGTIRRALEKSLAHPHASGGTPMGDGVEYLRESGGLIYDSGMGGYNLQEDRGVLKAKQLSQTAIDAVEAVRQMPGHEDFTPTGYETLKQVAAYKLRSDGSR